MKIPVKPVDVTCVTGLCSWGNLQWRPQTTAIQFPSLAHSKSKDGMKLNYHSGKITISNNNLLPILFMLSST